jgi:hypothetical protein
MDLQKKANDLLKSEFYDDRDYNPAIGYSLADEVMKEDWDDPMMAEYDRYEEYTRPKGNFDCAAN